MNFILLCYELDQLLICQHKFDRCEDCKLVILNPRVAPDELGEYYKSYYLPYRGDKAWGKYADMVAKDQSKIDDARLATLEKYTTITQHNHRGT